GRLCLQSNKWCLARASEAITEEDRHEHARAAQSWMARAVALETLSRHQDLKQYDFDSLSHIDSYVMVAQHCSRWEINKRFRSQVRKDIRALTVENCLPIVAAVGYSRGVRDVIKVVFLKNGGVSIDRVFVTLHAEHDVDSRFLDFEVCEDW